MFDEAALLEKLRKIEALHAGATTEGERAAAQAAQRISERLAQTRVAEPDVIRQYSIHDTASRRLFIALCRRYGVRPYRYPRQHRSTLCVRAPESFQSKLWDHYCAADDVLGNTWRRSPTMSSAPPSTTTPARSPSSRTAATSRSDNYAAARAASRRAAYAFGVSVERRE